MGDSSSPILDVRGATKRFPGTVALDGVDFSLRRGEVHALVGENGAGKSTLIKVMTGAYQSDEGAVHFDGQEVRFARPRDAQQAGIATIYQEVNLIPFRSVAENVFLGREPRGRFGLLDRRHMVHEAREILGRFGLAVDVRAPLRTLGIATQQMVAIARAVSQDARVVVMDEPTSSLEAREVETLFEVIRQLQRQGVAVVYVSHRLSELYAVCDRVTILRDGRLVHTGDLESLPRLDLIAKMLGRPLPEVSAHTTSFHDHEAKSETPVLSVRDLTMQGTLRGVSLDVHAGEIVGLAGLLGSGRTETAKGVFGALPVDGGTVELEGDPIDVRGPAGAVRQGIVYLSEDRKEEGILPDLSVRDNIIAAALPRLSKFGFTSDKKQDELVERFMQRLRIKAASPSQPVRELSGGNQQKVLLARWLCVDPKVVLLDEPTRGIDVGAKAEVQGLIDEMADEGLGVVFISSETDELLEGCTRIVVLREGAAVGTLQADSRNESELMRLLAAGGEGVDEAEGVQPRD